MALNAYQKTLNNALKKQPVINNPLLELAQQGATTGATPTPTTPTTGAVNTGNLTAAQIQSLRENAQRGAATAQDASNAKTMAERNEILRQSAQQAAVKAGVPGSAQAMAATKTATPTPPVTQQPTPQQTAFQAYMESAAPQQQYLWRNMGDNEMHTMNEGEQRLWKNAMTGYANGDYSAFNRDFQTAGNWGSYVDENGKVSGMLRYAGDGVGGYVPINNGKIMQNGFSGDIKNYAFYGPNGEVYTADANGNLFKTGTWTDQYDSVMKNGYYKNDVNDYGDRMFIGKDGQEYTYNNVPDEKLAEWGYVRRNGGIFYEPETLARNSPDGTWMQNNPLYNPGGDAGNTPSEGTPYGGTPSGGTPSGGNGGGSGSGSAGGYIGTGGTKLTPEQAYIAQYDLGNAPEWNGSKYDPMRDEALANAQGMKYTDDQYVKARDELLANALKPYEGSKYDPLRDEYIKKYGEEWQGSEYQPLRDEYAQKAADLQWNYDPDSDPVWQALQKQYRREGQRTTQDTLGKYAAMTGGMPSSYAVTAASQAGDYYASQLSDRLPQLYQDAYQRYLQEYSKLLGLSDQYAGFDDREYSRWNDQQGKNMELAGIYGNLGQQDYSRYQDQVNQQLAGADRYNQYDQTAYGRFLDDYDRMMQGADRYDQYGQREYGQYQDQLSQWNKDREFAEDQRRYGLEYALKSQSQDFDQWYKQQGLSMDQAQMAFDQWYKQQGLSMDQAQMVFDQWYKQQVLGQNQQEIDFDQSYKTTAYQDELARNDREEQKERAMVQAQLGNYAPLAELYGVTEEAIKNWLGVGDVTDAEQAYSSGGGGDDEGEGVGSTYTGSSTVVPRDESGNLQLSDEDAAAVSLGGKKGNAQTFVKGVVHTINRKPMTTGFQDWWPTIRDAYDQGATTAEIRQAIENLINQGIIEKYEKEVILRKLGIYGNGG